MVGDAVGTGATREPSKLGELLRMRHITKVFPGTKALDDVNFDVRPGEIHALVGENGAGKSTLMKVLSGIHPYGSYEGEIFYDGELCKFSRISESEAKGIVIIHQELALVPYLSIAENIFLGNEQGKAWSIDWSRTYSEADKLLARVGLAESSRTLVKDIGVGKQQLVEIAKALSRNVRLLILDEPTASLNENESRKLLDLLKDLQAKGLTSVLISHKLNEVAYVADRITVIRDGATIETLDKQADAVSEERIVRGMVGREMESRFPARTSEIGDVALEVVDWTVYHPQFQGRKVVDNAHLVVHRGEVVGVSGLMGAGRTELAMSIFGRSYGRNITGKLFIDGKEARLRNAKSAIEHKLAYVTEDRKGDGLILGMTIRENTTIAKLEKVSRRGAIIEEEEHKVAMLYVDKLHTKCSGVEQPANSLSGGNQQKLLLAKWMFADSDILILDEPTRGIDVGAKYEIYSIINQLVAEGKSVLMISSELPEILGMCDRIYVMNEGRVVGELSGSDADQEQIMTIILQSENRGSTSPTDSADRAATAAEAA
ncbi:MAG: sugar ABC transporter ATP-binding protein [Actinomycetes bacterium]|jgi:putative multiple sugar transport system ATP-binding protein|nr:sugar ABC transporter ATP-binding protein [Actinomycetes bacterium]